MYFEAMGQKGELHVLFPLAAGTHWLITQEKKDDWGWSVGVANNSSHSAYCSRDSGEKSQIFDKKKKNPD